ncbi:hypothetical protein Taro_013647 [Colocasia esculenta]|uniref:Uncharacterized protein n=1 Tax=Colocasia esculenta TaxID=4460 RepID=A0A843UCH1_COLES|nr:hypothetical protein [Colocasia esculenta]
MASRGRRGGVPTRDGEQRRDEPRREEQTEQQVPAPQGPVLPPPPPVDYGVFMQGLVQAMQTQAHTQAQMEAQGVQRGAPTPAAAAPATGGPGRPRAQARLFALAREDVEQEEHVTEGDPTSLEETVESDSERGE